MNAKEERSPPPVLISTTKSLSHTASQEEEKTPAGPYIRLDYPVSPMIPVHLADDRKRVEGMSDESPSVPLSPRFWGQICG